MSFLSWLKHRALLLLSFGLSLPILLITLLWTTFAGAMSMVGLSETVYLFSAMRAQLLYQGKPVPHAKGTREYTWKKKTTTETTMTDENGFFEFPTVTTEYVYALTEERAQQTMFADYQGNTILFWDSDSSSIAYEEYADFGGKPENMTCELSNDIYVDLKSIRNKVALIGTICSWQVIEADGSITEY